MKKWIALGFGMAVVVSGCATHKEWLVTGASRADGTVTLAYERNEFQSVQMSQEEADQLASKKCAAWGYSGAEAFGSQKTVCTSYRGFGSCGSRVVTVQYQCVGAPSTR